MLSAKKREVVEAIESTIVRGELVDGVYSKASFKIGKHQFGVFADFYEDGVRKGSTIYKDGKEYTGSIVSNGRYKDYFLCTGMSLMEHQLLAVCLLEGASERLINDSHAVINHKTILSTSVTDRENKRLYWQQVCARMFDDSVVVDESLIVPAELPRCDVRDLEVCTSAENVAHGAFIKTFDLYDVSISAHDVEALKSVLIDKDLVSNVIQKYLKFGVSSVLMDRE